MKNRDNFISTVILIICILSICFNYSCKKDNDGNEFIAPVYQRIVEVIGLEGGLEEYKDVYTYHGIKLSEDMIYLYDEKGEWREWLRLVYEYPTPDVLIETREEIYDSAWFPSAKWEKHFSGKNLIEMIIYIWDYTEGVSTGSWRAIRKITCDYDQNRILTRNTYKFVSPAWVDYFKSIYEYNGNTWTSLMSFENNEGIWDTIYRLDMEYSGGLLTEINGYGYSIYSGWSLDEQYILEYEGNNVSKMIINEAWGDSLRWDRTLSVEYNEYGNPGTYIQEYDCYPTETMIMTYEMQQGNFRQAIAGNSCYEFFPWFPAPVKKNIE